MGDFLSDSATTLTNTDSTVEQVVQETTAPSTTSEVIDLTNGFKLPPLAPPVSPSLSSLLFSSGSRATESLIRDTATNMGTPTSSSTERSANALLGTSSSIPPSISSTPSSTFGSSLVEAVDKGLIYAPSYPNYIADNATLKGQFYQWSHSQFLLNGTSGPIDWDSSLPNSLYGDAADPITSGAGTEPTVGTCDDVYVTENGMTYQVTVYCMYIVIFVLALLGNGVVCYIVQSSPRMRTVTNYFICNLAIGDILMSLFCVPFSFISILILGYWPFGVILCHLVNYSQAISVLVSAYTLVAISVDRYIVIMWPLRPRITKRWVWGCDCKNDNLFACKCAGRGFNRSFGVLTSWEERHFGTVN